METSLFLMDLLLIVYDMVLFYEHLSTIDLKNEKNKQKNSWYLLIKNDSCSLELQISNLMLLEIWGNIWYQW